MTVQEFLGHLWQLLITVAIVYGVWIVIVCFLVVIIFGVAFKMVGHSYRRRR